LEFTLLPLIIYSNNKCNQQQNQTAWLQYVGQPAGDQFFWA